MKKILLSTTTLVAVSVTMAPGAQASDPIELGLGGFMVQTFGYAENNKDYEASPSGIDESKNWDQKQASKVHFTGSAGLDNGITVSARIGMNTDGDASGSNFSMDEVFAKIVSPALGTLILGQKDGAITQLGHRSPAGGVITVDGGEVQPWAFIQRPVTDDPKSHAITGYGGGMSTTSINTFPDEQNHNRITYLSPRFMGLGFGLSFNPDAGHTSRAAQPAGDPQSDYSAALAYDDTLGRVKIGADIGYRYVQLKTHSGQGVEGVNTVRGGLSLSYAGFTLGGAYARHIEPTVDLPGSTTSWDGESWDVGLTYATGPYTVGVTHARTRAEGFVTSVAPQDKVRFTVVGGTYTLSPGIIVGADLMFAAYSGEVPAARYHNDGWGVNASLVLAF